MGGFGEGIQPQKGVRRGCLLAPLLFSLAVDMLIMCTIQAYLQGMLRGYQTRSYLEGIPLLQYVNDTMFFMEGSMEEAKNLSTLLDLFADVSGLQINHSELAFMDF